MKNRWNMLLLVLYLITALICIAANIISFRLETLIMAAVPAFCSQLLLCRLTGNRWLRALPVLPVAVLLALAGLYQCGDGMWDGLAALILVIAAIPVAAGCVLGWAVWKLTAKKRLP